MTDEERERIMNKDALFLKDISEVCNRHRKYIWSKYHRPHIEEYLDSEIKGTYMSAYITNPKFCDIKELNIIL